MVAGRGRVPYTVYEVYLLDKKAEFTSHILGSGYEFFYSEKKILSPKDFRKLKIKTGSVIENVIWEEK